MSAVIIQDDDGTLEIVHESKLDADQLRQQLSLRPTLRMHCDECGTETLSDLNRWALWYTTGEVWSEECSGCGRHFMVTLEAEAVTQ